MVCVRSHIDHHKIFTYGKPGGFHHETFTPKLIIYSVQNVLCQEQEYTVYGTLNFC